MDVRLAFAVQDVPSEALAFSNKSEAVYKCRSKLNLTPWRPFRSCCFVNSENVAGRLGVPRGNSRWFPLGLVWAKRHDVSGLRPFQIKIYYGYLPSCARRFLKSESSIHFGQSLLLASFSMMSLIKARS
jgi:hypothetical protein